MNPQLDLFAGLLAGLLASTHCLGMCGGIALNLTPVTKDRLNALPWLFNLGRIGSYGIAGLIAGTLGWWIGQPLVLRGWIQASRLLLGLLMIAIALQALGIDCGLRRLEKAGQPVWRRLAPLTRRLLPANTPLRALALGGLWGYLPCGLIYTMLLAAMASHSPWQGAQLLLGFGVGTAPAMLGAARLSVHLKQLPIRRLGATLLLLSGVWTASAPWLVPHDHEHGLLHSQAAMTNPLKPTLESPADEQATSHLHHSP